MTWSIVPLRDLICLADSGTWGDEAPEGAGCPVLRSSNIQGGRLDLSEVAWRLIPKADTARRLLQSGDLLITKSSGSPELIGKCCQFTQPEVGTDFYFSNFTLRLRADHSRADSRWLYYWLSSPRGRAVIAAMNTTTSGLRNLNVELYLSQLVPTPPLTDQRRIAAILDKADAICRKCPQALQLTDDLLRSAFVEMFGDPVTNPKSWGQARLDSVGEIRSGLTKGRRLDPAHVVSVPYMRVANVQDGHIALDDVKDIEILRSEVDTFRLLPGDILLTEGGDPDKLGRGAVWHGQIDPCVHQNHIFRVRPDTHVVLPDFLSTLIGSSRGKAYFLRAAKQTTGIATINRTQLAGFPVLLPPIDLQRRYATLVEEIAALQARMGVRSHHADTLFESLCQRAFCGDLNLRE